MSKIALKPNASGTGVFSLEAPNSNTDRTLTLPDEEGTVATIENIPPGYEDQDALNLFNVTGSAPVYACRAWVNFDGTGTVSIRDSGNVSSITDRGTGQYAANFSTAMTDANYSSIANTKQGDNTFRNRSATASPNTSGQAYVNTWRDSDGAHFDCDLITVAVFR